MIIARFNCPACETPIEAPANSVAQGVRCPQCDTGFVPDKTQVMEEPNAFKAKSREEVEAEIKKDDERRKLRNEREEREEKWRPYETLRQDAGACFTFGAIFMATTILLVFVGFSDSENIAKWLAGATGAFSASIILFFFSQCLHIRAALEKLHLKE